MSSHRIVLTTFGSLGDLHPYLAIGQQLRRHGCEVVVATQQLFRDRVRAAGLQHHTVRSATTEQPDPELVRRVFAGGLGVRYLIRELVMPMVAQAFEDTLAAAQGADLLVSHPLTLTAPLAAEHLGIPWVSSVLAPSLLFSAYDPPSYPGLGRPSGIAPPPWLWRLIARLTDWTTRRWVRPLDRLRTSLKLPDRGNPVFRGAISPFGTLALFSSLLGQPQRDWPAGVTVTGFPFFDEPGEPLSGPLQAWLADGSAPVVFTLGSSAVITPGVFFAESIKAARKLHRRALLVGYAPEGVLARIRRGEIGPGGLVNGDSDVFAVPYASYGHIFPHAAVTVHQGGIGTTAQALRAGRPTLVVPFGVDQPDNAVRAQRLGVAGVIARRRYQAPRVAAELDRLLREPYVRQAAQIGSQIHRECGAERAADVLLAALRRG